jgi:hypothetical protein
MLPDFERFPARGEVRLYRTVNELYRLRSSFVKPFGYRRNPDERSLRVDTAGEKGRFEAEVGVAERLRSDQAYVNFGRSLPTIPRTVIEGMRGSSRRKIARRVAD